MPVASFTGRKHLHLHESPFSNISNKLSGQLSGLNALPFETRMFPIIGTILLS